MARRLFLFLSACLIGVICNPYILTAADHFSVIGLDNTNIVETIPPKKEPAPEPVFAPPIVSAPIIPSNNIKIAGRILPIIDVSDTAIDSGDHVNKYGGQFYYGHNNGMVFGGLASLGIGSGFSITYNGVTTNYQVANITTFEKNPSTGQLQLNGAGDLMYPVAQAQNNGIQYSIAIMTCAGNLYGNGDASHRLVIFANAV